MGCCITKGEIGDLSGQFGTADADAEASKSNKAKSRKASKSSKRQRGDETKKVVNCSIRSKLSVPNMPKT